MNADETVRGLRYTQKKYENKVILTGETDVSAMCRDSADLIESLQAQLAASQHRERAAVEDLHWMHTLCMDIGGCCPECGNQIDDLMDAACTYCKKSGEGCWEDDPEISDKCSAFEWRGPQEAGEGEAK